MELLESGFFKATPINNNELPKFIWIDEPDEQRLAFIEFSVSPNFYEGCRLSRAERTDPDFIRYVNADLVSIEKDILKLTKLKQNLLSALN